MGHHFKEIGNWYVSALGGDDTTGDGTPHKPFKTINKAKLAAMADATQYQTIVIGSGIYNEELDKSDNTEFLNLIGDGKVILDGTGVTYAFDGRWYLSVVKNITFVNYSNFEASDNGNGVDIFDNCNFINITEFWPVNISSDYTYVRNFQNCKC